MSIDMDRQIFTPKRHERGVEARRTFDDELGPLQTADVEVAQQGTPDRRADGGVKLSALS